MSRTTRRTHVKLRVKKDAHTHLWHDYYEWEVSPIAGRWDWENHFYTHSKGDEFDYSQVERDIKKYYSDSGTRKNFSYLKKLLNNRYRELNRKQLHNYLRQEDGELQTYTFRKYDFGYYWD